jgi:hypothetical protein
VGECGQKFIFNPSLVLQEIDEGRSFLEEVSKHVLIMASLKRDSGDAREGFYWNRALHKGRAQGESFRDLIRMR